MDSNSKLGHSTKGYFCETCHKEFSTMSNLWAHKKLHLAQTDYKCSFCGYVTNIKVRLTNHIQTQHSKERPFECKQSNCNTNFPTLSALDDHKRIHINEVDDQTSLESHSDVKKFSCNLCPFGTNHKADLERHFNAGHLLQLRPSKCPQPNGDNAAARNLELNTHKLSHHMNKEEERATFPPFKCSQCPYKSSFKNRLDEHLKVHLPEKGFSCDLCPYRTRTKDNLSNHWKFRHSTEKSLKQSAANLQLFVQKRDLTKHFKVHSRDK